MSGDGFAELLAHLDRLAETSAAAAAEGLRSGASRLENTARASDAYQNQTGATREGTVAYVVGGGRDDSDVVDTAAALVQDKNPGHVETSTAEGPGADEVAVILTVPTTYDDELESRAAHLAPALTQEQLTLLQAAAQGLAKAFR